MNRPFFSIIIPVYNVEDYLRECVQSVLSQNFPDFEIILVDDGSTDSSGRICDDLSQTDSRIKILHQENQGLSGARNSGLQIAAGIYVLFLDSDDFYPQTSFLGELQAQCGDSDIICFNYARYTDRLLPAMIQYPSGDASSKDELFLNLVRDNAYVSSSCFKAVRRSLLLEHNMQFELNTISEDIEWSARLMLIAKSISIAPQCMYAYRVCQNSITHSVSVKHVQDQFRTIKRLTGVTVNGPQALHDAYWGYIAFQYCTMIINALLCKPKLPEEKFGEIKQMAWLLQHDANKIVKLIHLVYKFLGFTLTSRLLLIYFKFFGK